MCPPTCYAVSQILNFVLVFAAFASLRNSFLTRGKSQGNFVSSLQPMVAGFYPGHPGPISRQGTKIQDCSLLSSRSKSSGEVKDGEKFLQIINESTQ